MPTPREMMEAAQRAKEASQGAHAAHAQQPEQAEPVRRQVGSPEQASRQDAVRQSERQQGSQRSGRQGTRRRQQMQVRQVARSEAQPGPQPEARPEARLDRQPEARPEPPHRPRSRFIRNYITRWRMGGVAAFAAIMLLGGVIGLLFFARPATSAVEMRNLTAYPEFTVESFLDGSYFTQVSLWYADTYPLREPMVAADHAIDGLFGINTGTGMVGGNVKADEIPVDDASVGVQGEGAGEVPPATKAPLAAAPDEHAVAEDIQENIMSGVYIQDGAGYAIYYFSQQAADTYIAAMNTAAERLDGTSTVYSIMAPANSITLPEDQAASLGGSDQQQTLDYLSTRFDSRVKAVDLVDSIRGHSDEYLYFHTDHHWTQLGAYYAYVAFCEQAGITPKQLSDWEEVDLGEFQGTYYDTIESMGQTATDEVIAYVPSSTNSMTYWTSDGDEIEGPVVDTGATSWEPSYKYSAFIAGDQPLEVIHNPKLNDGSSCLIVKDSYGCAFVPELVDHYETVHVIDFRDTDKNICDYAIENDIDDVIFMTGIKIGLTDSVAATLLSEVAESIPEPEAIVARVIYAVGKQS